MQTPSERALLFGIILAVLAAPAAAQQPAEDRGGWHPRWGDWSLAFALPTGGGAGLGFWKQRSPNLALGLTLEALLHSIDREGTPGSEDGTRVRLAAGPALKRYWWRDGPVSPFLHAGLDGRYERIESGGRGIWRMGGGLSLGLGAEWFPARGIGIGGHTGATASYLWTTDDDSLTPDESHLLLNLFTSSLTVQLYF